MSKKKTLNRKRYMNKSWKEKRTTSFGGRVFKKVESFSDEFGRLSRKAQAALSFELKEEFKLKDVLHIVGIPESTYHYQIKAMKKGNPNQELEDCIQSIFEENDGNYGYRRIHLELNTEDIK